MARRGIVTATQLHLRTAPSPNHPVIRTLTKGMPVQVIEDLGEWLKVSFGGQTGFVSDGFIQSEDLPVPSPTSPVVGKFSFNGKSAVAPDGTQFATKFKLGVFNNGTTSISQFIRNNDGNFSNVPRSRLRVMQAVSVNEGKLEAINTWDNAFLTFGIFQWTVGQGSGPGELPALVDRLKKRDPAVFKRYFADFGLDTVVNQGQPGVTPTGFFKLNGILLRTPSQKEQLRTLEWAYRFWLAGNDNTVRQVQVEHAMERVDLFYRSVRHKVRGRFISDYVTSEYGVALILDQHVNRPGHVPDTIDRAASNLITHIGIDDPRMWTDAHEMRLLDIYLQLRTKTSMTDSNKRADTVRQAVASGLASNRRGSYQI